VVLSTCTDVAFISDIGYAIVVVLISDIYASLVMPLLCYSCRIK
jgi:hypothetical protein